jgi:hypothetical protein
MNRTCARAIQHSNRRRNVAWHAEEEGAVAGQLEAVEPDAAEILERLCDP